MSQSVEGPLELELQHLVLILDSASFVIYVLSILVSVWLALKVLWCRINEKIHVLKVLYILRAKVRWPLGKKTKILLSQKKMLQNWHQRGLVSYKLKKEQDGIYSKLDDTIEMVSKILVISH
jgi:hypothetical protein